MSQPPTPTGHPEKTMSSRLMTMKFMQRAAASSLLSTPPQTPDGPHSKHRKTSALNTQSPVYQSSLPQSPSADTQIFQAAAEVEDAKRVAAIEKTAAKAGETKWVLSTANTDNGGDRIGKSKLCFFTAGYSDVDQVSLGPGRQELPGRRRFGQWKREEEVGFTLSDSDTGASSSADEWEDHADTDSKEDGDGTDANNSGSTRYLNGHRPVECNSKSPKKGKHAQKADAGVAAMHRNNEVKLNRLNSISGGGGGSGIAGMECHFCGTKGHKHLDCPKKARLKRRRDDK
ncbi:MAG: hypothetical protein Q9166_006683 [cf. Caloplaca sp. 2 TL-2023]